MSSGSFTSASAWAGYSTGAAVYYSGNAAFDVWPGGAQSMSGYLPGSGSISFQIPPAALWLPAAEGLTKLTFISTGTDDGFGWAESQDILAGGSVVASSVWTPAKALRASDVDALAINVRRNWAYGGTPNTYGRVGRSSTAQGDQWLGYWSLVWESTGLPRGQQILPVG